MSGKINLACTCCIKAMNVRCYCGLQLPSSVVAVTPVETLTLHMFGKAGVDMCVCVCIYVCVCVCVRGGGGGGGGVGRGVVCACE